MSHELFVKGNTKEELYGNLIPQIESLLQDEHDMISNMANITACIKDTFGFLWVGFYRVIGDELVLGPFQGPVACTRIKKGRGVCGTSWQMGNTVVVSDVDAFPGHIACSGLSKSEIVVPVFGKGELVAVLDIDSEKLNTFDEVDKMYLEKIVDILSEKCRIS
ncbi:MAG: GAF domain-containing protein [Candidatus Limimorpha sp.]